MSVSKILKYRADRGPVAYVLGMFALHVLLWPAPGDSEEIKHRIPEDQIAYGFW
jgi:hypothetical protein